jgi:hypothetical protein
VPSTTFQDSPWICKTCQETVSVQQLDTRAAYTLVPVGIVVRQVRNRLAVEAFMSSSNMAMGSRTMVLYWPGRRMSGA